jgi:predicted PurR-regulated permease PerM
LGILLTLLANLNREFTPELGWWLLQIGATFLGVHFLDSFGLQPYLYSNSVKAHPLEIFLVTLAAGTIGGIGGMVIAIPAYTIIRVMAKEFYAQFQERNGVAAA